MYFNCHTHFSFKYATLSVNDLFEQTIKNGVHKIVLTDINNTCAYIELLRICRVRQHEHNLEVSLGIEFRRDNKLMFIAVAKNNEGFYEINRFLSNCNNNNVPIPEKAPDFNHVYVIYPFESRRYTDPQLLHDYEFVGIKSSQLNLLYNSIFKNHFSRLVAWQPVTFKDKICHKTHKLLRSIHHNTLVSKIKPSMLADEDEIMLPRNAAALKFERYPELIRNAENLVADTHLDIELDTDKNIKAITGNFQSDFELLRTKAQEGFIRKYPESNKMLEERFNRELEIIKNRKFVSYYLISDDIIRFARHKNFPYVGRGSGANSMIAYCLGITNVDPIELDLYFERFLNPERSSPPDFDMDFSWKDRDAVTKYIFNKYGKEHVSLLGTHTTYKNRSVLRELGKVFGLPKEEIDVLVDFPERAKGRDRITDTILKYSKRIYQMPANISIHAGGVLITDQPIYQYTATDLPPKDFPVAHLEMHNAEDMGIFKFDVLSQRGLGHIEETKSIVKSNRGIEIDTERFQEFKKDPKIRELLSRGDTMGCFYVESPAMRGLLGKLKCRDYITLVAASSIIRPGVARSGMMRAYIERHQMVKNGKTYEAIHPKMDELMKETYGVMVYQEDVIKVAHHFAGLTLSEADILRRGMSGKFRSRKEFKRVEEKFFENCAKKGYPEKVTSRVWYEIESFSGYSFSKGHSASYAVESYQSLYLKAHFPLEFMVGVINNFGGFYQTEFYFHEARMSGAEILPPCINKSDYLTNISGRTITVGFIHLKSLEAKFAEKIVSERFKNGQFQNLDNFMRRLAVPLEQLRILIRAGAFRFTEKDKPELLWEAMMYFSGSLKNKHSIDMFNEEPKNFPLPPLVRENYEDALDELELMGFPLCDPFFLLKDIRKDTVYADELMDKINDVVSITGYLVTIKNTATKSSELMYFGTFYDSKGKVFDTVHFPGPAKKYPFRGRGFYYLSGRVAEDFGIPSIEVAYMEKLPMVGRTGANMSIENMVD